MKISPVFSYSTNNSKQNHKNIPAKNISGDGINFSKQSFKGSLVDEMYTYFQKRLNDGREEMRKDQIKQVWVKVTSDVAMVSDRLGITFRDARERYDKYVELGGIPAKKDGNEAGLNKVVGYSLEKLDLIKDAVSPIVLMLKDRSENKDVEAYLKNIPKGILFYGPGGSGKNFMAECFYEHFQEVASQKKLKINTIEMNKPADSVDDEEMINYIRETFENAECWDGTKHTVIYIKSFDDYVDNCSDNVLAELALQMTAANERGITWMAVSNKGAELPDWVFNPSRLSIAKPVRDIADNEMSAVMSYFWAKAGRYDKSNHDQIINFCKLNGVNLYPPYFMKVSELVCKDLKPMDKTFNNGAEFIAPVETDNVLAVIKRLKRQEENDGQENQVNKSYNYTPDEEERLIGMKIGKNMAMME